MDQDHSDRHGFILRYSEGWAMLTVPPENQRGRPVYADDIAARMKLLGIPPVPAKHLRKAVEEGRGRPVRLVEWPAGAVLGARVNIEIDGNGMTAYARLTPEHPGGAPADRKLVLSAVKHAGIRMGIDHDAVEDLLKGPERKVVVARGRAPKPGAPAGTRCLFVTERGKPWKEKSGGRVDLKELNFIQNRKAGDLLAKHVPSLAPEEGCDVYGNPLPADPVEDELPLIAGEGVVENETGFVAQRDGNVRLKDGVIHVEPSVNVKNVDYSTGNIDFDGSVRVEGNVADGFTVKATGDIQVGKSVGRGYLDAGRNLILVAGIAGDGEGRCRSGENTYAKFLENAAVEASGDLIVTEAVLHSKVEINGDVFLSEGRGELTGGTAVIGGRIDCKRIGNVYAGETRIWVGCPPRDLAAFHELGLRLKTLRDEIDDLERQLDYRRSRKDSDMDEIAGLENGLDFKKKRLSEEAVRLKKIRGSLKPSPETVVIARERIYPGATIFFGLEEFPIGSRGTKKAVLKQEQGRNVIHGIKPGEEPG